MKEAKLPRRDWILMPMLSLLTIGLMIGSAELIADRMNPVLRDSLKPMSQCLIMSVPADGYSALPDSDCWDKELEAPVEIEYRFNSCGHRAGMECGPKPPGNYRIVMIGASTAFGFSVPREKTIAALLPTKLSLQTGRKIELYNESMLSRHPSVVPKHFDEVVAASPDMILWVLQPTDIENESPEKAWEPNSAKTGFWARAKIRIKVLFMTESIPDAVRHLWNRGVAVFDETAPVVQLQFLLEKAFYEDPRLYMKHYLMGGGDSGFMQLQTNADWQNRLRYFDRDAADTLGRAKAAGVPLVVVLLPNLPQAIMISMGEWPEGFDPYKLDRELRTIVTSHGGTYIDILSDFRTIPNPERAFFPWNPHPNADGHAIIADLLTKRLTSGTISALKVTSQTQAEFEKGK